MKEAVKERLKKFAPYLGYPVVYLVCLIVFTLLSFPYDKLKERIVTSFNAQQRSTNGSQELQIDEMGGYWLSGVKMKGVKLVTAPSEPGKPPTELKIDEARVRVSMLPLLIGNEDVNFSMTGFGGEVHGSYDNRGKERAVDVVLDSVDLGQVDPLVQLIGVPIEGKLSGEVKLTMPEGKATKGNGSVELEAKDVAVGDGKAKLKGALALPRLAVGDLSFSAEAKDGVLKITKISAGGKDLELQGEGRIQMRELATDSLCEVNVRFKINDQYRTKNDVTKNLFGAPGSNAPPFIELDPKVKQAKRQDGFYGWMVRGPLGHLDFIPSGIGGVGGFGMGATGTTMGTGAAPPLPFGTMHGSIPAAPKPSP